MKSNETIKETECVLVGLLFGLCLKDVAEHLYTRLLASTHNALSKQVRHDFALRLLPVAVGRFLVAVPLPLVWASSPTPRPGTAGAFFGSYGSSSPASPGTTI